MRKPPYFKQTEANAPAPLIATIARVSRFEEVDAMHIVWHGRYPSYFEDARVAFGGLYGLGYMDFHREGVLVPIKQMFIDYLVPIRFAQEIAITARLHYSEAAKLNFEYEIKDAASGQLLTTGFTIQLFLQTKTSELLLGQPDFYANLCARWKEGRLN